MSRFRWLQELIARASSPRRPDEGEPDIGPPQTAPRETAPPASPPSSAAESGDPTARRTALSAELERCERDHGPEHPDTAAAVEALAIASGFTDMEAGFRRCLDIRERVLGPEHPDTARIRHFLGVLLQHGQQYSEALGLLERNLEIHEAWAASESARSRVPPDELSRFDQLLGSLAICYRGMNEFDKAEACWRRVLARAEGSLGPEHVETASSLTQLGNFLAHAGRYDEAVPYLARAMAILEAARGPDDLELGTVAHLTSTVLGVAGDLAAAEQYRQTAVRVFLANRTIPPPRLYRRPGGASDT